MVKILTPSASQAPIRLFSLVGPVLRSGHGPGGLRFARRYDSLFIGESVWCCGAAPVFRPLLEARPAVGEGRRPGRSAAQKARPSAPNAERLSDLLGLCPPLRI